VRDLQAVVLPTELESQRATLTSGLLPFLLRDIESAQASYFACEVETASDGPPPWTLYCSQRFDEMQELYKGAQPNTRRAKQATEARLPPDQGACSTRDPATLADAQPLVTGPVRVIVIPDLSWGYFEAPLTHVEVDEVFDAVQRFLATKYRRADFVPRKEARKAISQILASMRGEKAAPKSCAYTPSLVSGLCPLYGNLWVATVRALAPRVIANSRLCLVRRGSQSPMNCQRISLPKFLAMRAR